MATWRASDYAAWWGAIIATLALGWNVVSALRRGPRVRVTAMPNMLVVPDTPATKGKTFISVTAVNRGDAATTITRFCGHFSRNWWDRLRRKRQHFFIPTFKGMGTEAPHVLRPGEEWMNFVEQERFWKGCPGGFLSIGVTHNQRKRPVYARIRVPSNSAGDRSTKP